MSTISLYANDLILFSYVASAGSFTRAAEQTGLPKSTLSRRLSELEATFGERLIQRSTRRLVLTEFGQSMLAYARRLADESQEAAALALHRQLQPQGTLRVSLPPEFHELSLVQVLTEFARKYPDVRLDVDLSTRPVDLVAERFDVAVRAATRLPDDSTLVARHIITLHNGLYASPAYLQRHGLPQTPADLENHTGLVQVTGNNGGQQPWQLSSEHGQWRGLPGHVSCSNSLGLQRELAVQGLGIVGLSERFAVSRGALQRVLPDWNLPPSTLWCVTPGRRLLPQRTLAFMSILKTILAGES